MNDYVSSASAWSYQHLVKPVVFKFDAETVHNLITNVGQQFGHSAFIRSLIERAWAYQDPHLSVVRDGITFPNPIGLSAGFDYEGTLTQILPSVGFGWHTIGTITAHSYSGNLKPRLGRLPSSQALIVNKGLKNLGAATTIKHLKKTTFKIPTGISIASTNRAFPNDKAQILDILNCFSAFENSSLKHAYYELNISCPNTFGGEPFTTPLRLKKLLEEVDELQLSRPLYVKMPIDQSEAESHELLKIIDRYNVQGIISGNLTKDKSNPAVTRQDFLTWQTRKGNLSGKPTWDRSNRLISLAHRKFGDRFTIIGTGGIFSGEDALTKLALGADLLQLITGMIYQGPQLIGQINRVVAKQTSHL